MRVLNRDRCNDPVRMLPLCVPKPPHELLKITEPLPKAQAYDSRTIGGFGASFSYLLAGYWDRRDRMPGNILPFAQSSNQIRKITTAVIMHLATNRVQLVQDWVGASSIITHRRLRKILAAYRSVAE